MLLHQDLIHLFDQLFHWKIRFLINLMILIPDFKQQSIYWLRQFMTCEHWSLCKMESLDICYNRNCRTLNFTTDSSLLFTWTLSRLKLRYFCIIHWLLLRISLIVFLSIILRLGFRSISLMLISIIVSFILNSLRSWVWNMFWGLNINLNCFMKLFSIFSLKTFKTDFGRWGSVFYFLNDCFLLLRCYMFSHWISSI